jgi:membrane dipeptidase
MRKNTMKKLSIVMLLFAGCAGDEAQRTQSEAGLASKAEELAREFIIVDTHIDVPYRMTENWEDISSATQSGDFDYPRAVAGGLDAAFMSVYIPAKKQGVEGLAAAFADSLIDMVEGFVQNAPDKFAAATTPEQVRANRRSGLISLPMGMENGAPIGDLDDLEHFYNRGIRYITLTHGSVNQISDSSYDTTRTWNGLSPFGEEVVREMNRLGIMVDVSHVTDSAFWDVMRITRAPVIASHSSARRFTPGFERNMSDAMIQALGDNGGVIMINFGSAFLTEESNKVGTARWNAVEAYLKENDIDPVSEEGIAYRERYFADHPAPFADVTDVADHIDHVVGLTSVEQVGLGSDYDGVGDSLPTGLKDVSQYPNLIEVLLQRGYSETDIEKILGGNLLRVWEEVERVAGQK